jgi:hypothetical protein
VQMPHFLKAYTRYLSPPKYGKESKHRKQTSAFQDLNYHQKVGG